MILYSTINAPYTFRIFLWNKIVCPHCFDKKRIVGKKNFFWPAKNLKLGSVWLKNRFYFNTNSNIWYLRLCVSRPFSLFFSSLIMLIFLTKLEYFHNEQVKMYTYIEIWPSCSIPYLREFCSRVKQLTPI